MLTFVFLCLTLVLFGTAIFFIRRSDKREFQLALKAQAQRAIRKDRERNRWIAELGVEVERLSSAVQQIPAAKNILAMSSVNVKENMEMRHIRENPKVVAVDGVQKVI